MRCVGQVGEINVSAASAQNLTVDHFEPPQVKASLTTRPKGLGLEAVLVWKALEGSRDVADLSRRAVLVWWCQPSA